jgi:DNA (cytosine-5)-methyltransferase 1
MKIGTDFSGIGSPESALKRLGLDVEEVFACEIDKYARKSFNELHNPNTFYEDITTRNHSEVPQLDLYVAGFPCQSFSMAGNRGGFEDTRGTLFFNVAEFIKENQPKCFVLENVKGLLSHDSGKTYQTITDVLTNGGGTLNGQIGIDTIDNGLGYHVYAKVLNTKDYGVPQNRERIFLVGFKEPRDFNFPKKMELKLRLKDLLENEVDDKYYLSEKMISCFTRHRERHESKGNGFKFNTKDINSYANCLDTKEGTRATNNYISHSLYPRSSTSGKGGSGHLSKSDGTSYCVDTGCSQGVEVIQLNPSLESVSKQPYQQNRVYDIESVNPSLTTIWNGANLVNTKRIRRLTPLECWRLQGFTDEQFYKAQKVNSDTQLYKQAGNSITVNVLVELFKKIYLCKN